MIIKIRYIDITSASVTRPPSLALNWAVAANPATAISKGTLNLEDNAGPSEKAAAPSPAMELLPLFSPLADNEPKIQQTVLCR